VRKLKEIWLFLCPFHLPAAGPMGLFQTQQCFKFQQTSLNWDYFNKPNS